MFCVFVGYVLFGFLLLLESAFHLSLSLSLGRARARASCVVVVECVCVCVCVYMCVGASVCLRVY